MTSAADRSAQRDTKGSRCRCLALTHGPGDAVAAQLTALSSGRAVVAAGRHTWMPRGWQDRTEAELSRPTPFLPEGDRGDLADWWLAARSGTARTPNWDLVSRAIVGGSEGLLLVEAKAHPGELDGEEPGKRLSATASSGSRKNHGRIGACIAEASEALHQATGLAWGLSRDHHYQLANRFAWAWRVASQGRPVVLVYLGFLQANEMPSRYPDAVAWEAHVRRHADGVVPGEAWGRVLPIGGASITPLIHALHVPCPTPT